MRKTDEVSRMYTKEVTVTIQLPTEFESLNQLEMAIHTEGQRIKQQLFEQELQAIIDQEKEKASDEAIACPDCQKKTASSGEEKPDN